MKVAATLGVLLLASLPHVWALKCQDVATSDRPARMRNVKVRGQIFSKKELAFNNPNSIALEWTTLLGSWSEILNMDDYYKVKHYRGKDHYCIQLLAVAGTGADKYLCASADNRDRYLQWLKFLHMCVPDWDYNCANSGPLNSGLLYDKQTRRELKNDVPCRFTTDGGFSTASVASGQVRPHTHTKSHPDDAKPPPSYTDPP